MSSVPDDFFARNTAVREEIIEGMIRENQLVSLGGGFGAGKSPLLADLTVHVIHGLAWCGRATARRPVIAFDFETDGPTYRRNLRNIADRLGIPHPKVPDELDVYLQNDPASEPATAKLLGALGAGPDTRLDLIREGLKARPDALVIIDPVDLLFPIDKLKGVKVLRLYKSLRSLLAEYPRAAIINTFNLRKKDRRFGGPSLLVNPRQWLEEVSGSLDIQNRSDVRLGLDMYDDDVRVLNGIRRGEEMDPLLIHPVDCPPNGLSGFELAGMNPKSIASALTPAQLSYWRKLADDFRFEDVADKVVPRSSLSRLVRHTKSLGILRGPDADGVFRKV